MIFNTSNIDELKNYLYYSCVHDSVIKSIDYDYNNSILRLELYNTFYSQRIIITCRKIEMFYVKEGNWIGERSVVNSLTVVENNAGFIDDLGEQIDCNSICLHLLLQTFSESEIHIIANEVVFNVN